MNNIFIEEGCVVHPTAVVMAPNHIEGGSVIGEGTILYPCCYIKNSIIGKNVEIKASYIFDSKIGDNVTIGPNAHIRKNCNVSDNVRIGNYVELKNATIGKGTKIAHLTYIGDADVGSACNIGCGVVFCNYDGVNKHHTTVKDKVFVGSNCNLVAPLCIGEGVFIAAGSTVTESVEDGNFVIARSKQLVKPKREK